MRDADSCRRRPGPPCDDVNEQLDDLANKYVFYTAEDRADVQNNLADLAEHVIQGQPNLAQQDLAVLERSVDNIREDVNETAVVLDRHPPRPLRLYAGLMPRRARLPVSHVHVVHDQGTSLALALRVTAGPAVAYRV